MERTAGDPKNAEPDIKSAAGDPKSAVPDDKGAAGDPKSAVPDDKGAADFRSEDQKRVVDKREPPHPHLPTDAGVGRSGSDDKPAFPRSRLNASAPEFIPRARTPSLTPPSSGSVSAHSGSSTPTTPASIKSASPPPARSSDLRSSRSQQRRQQRPMQGYSSPSSGSGSTHSRTPTPTTPLSIGSASPSPARSSEDRQQQPMHGFSAVARHGSTVKLEIDKNKREMLEYLNSPYYKDKAANLGRKLTIDFEDLLQKNRKLAIGICNHRGSNDTWLDQACKEFFESNQLPSDSVTFEFDNIPSRLWEARHYMISKDCTEGRVICNRTSYVETATEHGRKVTDLVLNRVLDNVADNGVSWDGKLGLGDILFGETMDGQVEVYIAKSPVHKSPAALQDRLSDVKSIWVIIKEGCKLNESNLPLYFLELKSDLESASELGDWFIKYLRFHPALYAPMPRRYFITSMQMVTRRLTLITDKEYGSLFTVPPLPGLQDWRSIASDGPLQQLLNFKFKYGKKSHKEDNHPNKAPQYANNYGSLLDYVKNGLSHLAEYIPVTDDEEIELFLAQKFPKLLQHIMKGILMRGGMDHRFSACWKAYCNTK